MGYTMKMATIVPQNYLELTADAPIHMALAHLIGAEGMEAYTDFYKNIGGYKILDNGAAEGNQVTIQNLIEKAELIGANEIILPDVMKDSRETFYRAKEDIAWLRKECLDNRYKLQIVPQGDSLDDWLKCASNCIHHFGMDISAIGVPKHLVKTCNDRDARLKAIYDLSQLCPEIDQYDIHLLGCWKTPLEVLFCAKASEQEIIPPIRSCDSAIAYVYADAGLKFSDDDKPHNSPINFKDGKIRAKDEMLLQYNIASWIAIGNPAAERTIYFL